MLCWGKHACVILSRQVYTFEEIDQLFDDLGHDAKVRAKRTSDQGSRNAGSWSQRAVSSRPALSSPGPAVSTAQAG